MKVSEVLLKVLLEVLLKVLLEVRAAPDADCGSPPGSEVVLGAPGWEILLIVLKINYQTSAGLVRWKNIIRTARAECFGEKIRQISMVITINKDQCFKWNTLTLTQYHPISSTTFSKHGSILGFKSNKRKVSKMLLIKEKDCCTKFLTICPSVLT